MLRKIFGIFILSALVISLSGCATARKQREQETQGLKNQVSVLEAQVQEKDQQISALRDALSSATEEKARTTKGVAKKKVIGEVKSRPTVKHIQVALSNAGYNPGTLDGKMGRQTKDAIRAFQRANDLAVDGRVGKRTWGLLREYLYKKIK